MKVLVTDGENRSALAVTRSLGRKGYNVFVSSKIHHSISGYSKFCKKKFITPDPTKKIQNYSKVILEIANKENIDIIFPTTEQSILCLNQCREQLENYCVRLACPSFEKLDAVSNKFELFRNAENLGVAIPETFYSADVKDFFQQVKHLQKYPVVVKPGRSKIVVGDRIISGSVMYAENERDLCHLYETKPELHYPSLIQELIIGEGTGLFTLFDYDRHLALFSHRRLLEKPPSGGVSVLSQSVQLDNEMVDFSTRLLSSVEWQGIAMVEFKRDVKDGRTKLMEINGRPWGSLQLAISSGVDFPSLYLEYLLGVQKVNNFNVYKVEYKLRWLLGILDHLIIRLKNENQLLKNHPNLPSKSNVLFELMKIWERNSSFDVFDINDFKPFLHEVREYIKEIIIRKQYS